MATNSTTGDNGPFRPNGRGRAQEEAPPPTMVAIKTPPPIPGESAPAICRWHHARGNPAQGNKIRGPMGRQMNATGGRTDRFGSFVSMLGTKRFLMEQCNSGRKRPRRRPASPVAVRRGPAQGTEPRDLGCTAPRICVINRAGLQGSHGRRSVPRPYHSTKVGEGR